MTWTRNPRAIHAEGTVLPSGEFDILLGGDLNASKFDDKLEQFFIEMGMGDWAVLTGESYTATRLAGVPLKLNSPTTYVAKQSRFSQ